MDVISLIETLSQRGHQVRGTASRALHLRPQCLVLGNFLKQASEIVSTYSVQLCLDHPEEVEMCVKGLLAMMDRADALMQQCSGVNLFRLMVNAGKFKMQFQSIVRTVQLYLTSLPKSDTVTSSISQQGSIPALLDVVHFTPYDSLGEMEALYTNLQDMVLHQKAAASNRHINQTAEVQSMLLEALPNIAAKLGFDKCDLEEEVILLALDVDMLSKTSQGGDSAACSQHDGAAAEEGERQQLQDLLNVIEECGLKSTRPHANKFEHPNGLICPISGELMSDPVVLAESGHTYERLPIEAWLYQQGGRTDPLTGVQLKQWPPLLVPNMNLRKVLEEYLKDNPEYAKSVSSLSAAQGIGAEAHDADQAPPPTEMPAPEMHLGLQEGQGGWTLLHVAAYEGNLDKVSDLIDAGMDVNAKGADDWTPLHWATLMGRGEVVVRLLQAWADVNLTDKFGRSPANFVQFSDNPQPVQALLEAGATIINANDKGGSTPLHTAAYNGDVHVVGALLATGADANKQNKEGWTPLHCASITGHTDVVEALLAAGACANVKLDKDDWTPLHLAACSGHSDTVKALVAGRANVNPRDKTGYTPLHAAAQNGHAVAVQELVAGHADVNIQDKYGWSPLHWAACKGNLEVALPLVRAGADVNARDKDGSTPRQWAARRGYQRLVSCMSGSASAAEFVMQPSSGSKAFWKRWLR